MSTSSSNNQKTCTEINFYLRQDQNQGHIDRYTILSYRGASLSKWQRLCKFFNEFFSFFSTTTYHFDQSTFDTTARNLFQSTQTSMDIGNLTMDEIQELKKQMPFFNAYISPKFHKVYYATRGDYISNSQL